MRYRPLIIVALLAAACGGQTHAAYLADLEGDDLAVAAFGFLSEVSNEMHDDTAVLANLRCVTDEDCIAGVERMLADFCDAIVADRPNPIIDIDIVDDIAWAIIEDNYPDLSKRDADPIAGVLRAEAWAIDNGEADWCELPDDS